MREDPGGSQGATEGVEVRERIQHVLRRRVRERSERIPAQQYGDCQRRGPREIGGVQSTHAREGGNHAEPVGEEHGRQGDCGFLREEREEPEESGQNLPPPGGALLAIEPEPIGKEAEQGSQELRASHDPHDGLDVDRMNGEQARGRPGETPAARKQAKQKPECEKRGSRVQEDVRCDEGSGTAGGKGPVHGVGRRDDRPVEPRLRCVWPVRTAPDRGEVEPRDGVVVHDHAVIVVYETVLERAQVRRHGQEAEQDRKRPARNLHGAGTTGFSSSSGTRSRGRTRKTIQSPPIASPRPRAIGARGWIPFST